MPDRAPKSPSDLRERAERAVGDLHSASGYAVDDVKAILHELHVHEIELEMQNEELCRGQAELTASRDAYRRLYDRAPVGYLTLDERGVCVDVNPKAAALLGVESARVRGRPLASLLSREAADRVHLYLQGVFEGVGPCTYELELTTATGAHLGLQLDSVLDQRGAARICHTTLTDVSERQRLLATLRALNEGLEARVAERTRALRDSHQRLELELAERTRVEGLLLEARKMEAVGRLAGGVAHDFNNLLTVMTLELRVLQRSGDHEVERERSLGALAVAIDRAAALTSELLAFARRGVGRPVPLELGAVLTELRMILRRLVPDAIDLVILKPKRGAWVCLDRTGLERVVVNIVVNSRDATPAGGRITVELDHVSLSPADADRVSGARAGDFVRLTVGDTGCGMPPEQMSRMFEPFFTTKGPERGSGLGLATVYGIVTASGGFFDVESVVGAGTRVHIFWPAAAEPAPQVVAAPPAPTAGSPSPVLRPGAAAGRATVLVVDDQDALRRVACRLLNDAGFATLSASSGAEAFTLLSQRGGDVDLVLSDILMPGISGHELAALIRTNWPRVPVMLMSGYVGDAAELESAGSFLLKPFNTETLVGAVRRALAGAERPAADA